jgi:hypothetical protein
VRNKIKRRNKYKIGKSPTPLSNISIFFCFGKPLKRTIEIVPTGVGDFPIVYSPGVRCYLFKVMVNNSTNNNKNYLSPQNNEPAISTTAPSHSSREWSCNVYWKVYCSGTTTQSVQQYCNIKLVYPISIYFKHIYPQLYTDGIEQ